MAARGIFLRVAGVCAVACMTAAASGMTPPSMEPGDIGRLLAPVRERHDIPAMAGAVLTSRGLEAVGWTGVRKRGGAVPVTGEDLWHLGSCTKAMTAAVVGKLVQEGKLRWDSTMVEIFPGIAREFHEDFRRVTLALLLTHAAGLPRDLEWGQFAGKDDLSKKRLQIVAKAFSGPAAYPPGNEHRYSNLGYVVVGAAIEKVTGKPWEDVIREVVFTPLEMSSAGFGGLGTPGEIDQPWGHLAGGAPAPANGTPNDNVPVMGPVGRVHCTIQDWAKFVRDQLRGERGEDGLLGAATRRAMTTPRDGSSMAMGWMVVERPWGGGRVLHHTGSNTMYYSNVWIAPARDFAVLVCANQGGDRAFRATDEAAGALIRWWLDRRDRRGASDLSR